MRDSKVISRIMRDVGGKAPRGAASSTTKAAAKTKARQIVEKNT
jgi:hypothetical protein